MILETSMTKSPTECATCGMEMNMCKCPKGLGGGDGEEDNQEEESLDISASSGIKNANIPNDLPSFLEDCPDWKSQDDFKFTLDGLSSEFAIQEISIDLGSCKIEFKLKNLLNSDSEKDIKALVEQLKEIVMAFDGAHLTIKDGSIEINHPNPKSFDMLVKELMKNDLLPVDSKCFNLNLEGNNALASSVDACAEQCSIKSPFDISKGPTPYDN